MSYNTDLQSNNTELQSILSSINNLPEAVLPSGITEVATGTFTFPDDTAAWINGQTFEHGMSGRPKLAILVNENCNNIEGYGSGNYITAGYGIYMSDDYVVGGTGCVNTSNQIRMYSYYKADSVGAYGGILCGETTLTIAAYSGYKFRGGDTYRWYAMR